MKKFMILSFAVLGMTLGSVSFIQPVNAQGTHCPYVLTHDGCDVFLCNEGSDNPCTIWACGKQGAMNYCDV